MIATILTLMFIQEERLIVDQIKVMISIAMALVELILIPMFHTNRNSVKIQDKLVLRWLEIVLVLIFLYQKTG